MSERGRSVACVACLAVGLAACLALIIPGHSLAAKINPTGELPLWYEVSTCANASDALTVSGYGGEEPASTSLATEAYTRSYWIQHGRVPSPNELVGSACPVAAREPGPFDITLEKDDGYRASASYGPNILVASGSYLLLSISVTDSAGNVLLPITNLELGPTDAFPWRLNGTEGLHNVSFVPAAPPGYPSPPAAPPAPPLPPSPPSPPGPPTHPPGPPAHPPRQPSPPTQPRPRLPPPPPPPPPSPSVRPSPPRTPMPPTPPTPQHPPTPPSQPPIPHTPAPPNTPAPPHTPPPPNTPSPPSDPAAGRRLLSAVTPPAVGRRLLYGALLSADPYPYSDDPRATDSYYPYSYPYNPSSYPSYPYYPSYHPSAPGARRLLKGGSTGGAAGAGGVGGVGGAGRGGAVGSRSGTMRGTAAASTGRASTGYYTSGGRGYYAGGRPYGYYYGGGAYGRGHTVMIVGMYGYGCYSCRRRTCRSCASCSSRSSCAATERATLVADYDRYELTSTSFVQTPAADGNWPLTLTVHNATLFTPATAAATPSSATLYLTFYTTSGREYEGVSGALLALGYIGVVILLCFCCCAIVSHERRPKRAPHPTARHASPQAGRAQTAPFSGRAENAVEMGSTAVGYPVSGGYHTPWAVGTPQYITPQPQQPQQWQQPQQPQQWQQQQWQPAVGQPVQVQPYPAASYPSMLAAAHAAPPAQPYASAPPSPPSPTSNDRKED